MLSPGLRWAALVLALALVQVAVHARAGFSFPPPWIDEAQFLWQAKAVADTGTLVAPQLDPTRPILWMPPGWFLFAGAVFRVLGFDYALARATSLACLLAAFVLLAQLLRRLPHPRAALLLAGAFFLGPTFVAAGNVARMEALLLLGVLAGFVCLQRGRHAVGIALLAATPLIHPNGVWFLAGGAIYTLVCLRGGRARRGLRAADVLTALLVAAAWLGYAALALAHREAFVHDLGYQLARKAGASAPDVLFDGRLLALAALLGLAWALRRTAPDAVLLAALALPALAAHSVGQEYWYEVFGALFELVLCVLVLEAALHWRALRPLVGERSALVLVLAALLLVGAGTGRVPNPFGFPESVVWHRMRFSDAPYLAPEDRAFVRGFLAALGPPGELPSVRFHPAAEALFYADLDGDEIRVCEPLFREETPDWWLLRTSRWHTSGELERALFARAAIEAGDQAHVIHRRGDTERWLAVRGR